MIDSSRREDSARRRVVVGRSDVNQAPITGESLPVDKGPGDEVFAGTINGHGALEVAVTRRRRDTTLARIIHLVEDRAGPACARAAVHRSLRALVHARRSSCSPSLVATVPPLCRRIVSRLVLSRARAAGRVVPVRAGHLDAGVDRVGAGRRRPARRAGQGRGSPRAARGGPRHRVRQDGNTDRGRSLRVTSVRARAWRDRSASCLPPPPRSRARSEHPIAAAIVRRGAGRAACRSQPRATCARCRASAPKARSTGASVVCGNVATVRASADCWTTRHRGTLERDRGGRRLAGARCPRRPRSSA